MNLSDRKSLGANRDQENDRISLSRSPSFMILTPKRTNRPAASCKLHASPFHDSMGYSCVISRDHKLPILYHTVSLENGGEEGEVEGNFRPVNADK